ncbi:MAG: prepilin signal peptidase PulO-like peptidase [Acidimicrobiales bacterium]|nr:prepilin signal peptidase PulO-like peptidase [Acidimicrobiales bacterium]
MTALLLVLLAVSGLVVGSFLNVVIVRVPAGESLVRPASRCPQCEAPIRSRDNVPVVSWLLLRGRCRSCGEQIPIGYPLVELGNAALWVAAGLRFGLHPHLFAYLALFSVLLALSVIDLELYILPNKITYPSIVVSALVVIPLISWAVRADPLAAIRDALVGGVAYAGFLLVTAIGYSLLARREGMGLGDVKLALLMGLYLGWLHPVLALESLIVSCVIGLVAGLGVLVVRKGKSEPYPFGPWLALGCIAAVLFSGPLLHIYGIT